MSVGAGAIGGGAEEMNLKLGSSPPPPSPLEQDALPSVGPLPHHLLPPPAVGG